MPLSPEERRQIEEAVAAAEQDATAEGLRIALLVVLVSASRRALKEDYAAARAALEGLTLARAAEGLAELFLPGSRERWTRSMRPVIEDVATAVTSPAAEVYGAFDPERGAMADFLDVYVSGLADRVSETTYEQVMEEIGSAQREGRSVSDTAKRIEETGEIETPKRARLIARNELQRTSKGASWAQVLESGLVSHKIRREQHDGKVRPEHKAMEGERVAIDEPYSNGELWAGHTDINCRGYDQFVIDFDKLENPL